MIATLSLVPDLPKDADDSPGCRRWSRGFIGREARSHNGMFSTPAAITEAIVRTFDLGRSRGGWYRQEGYL